MAILTRLYVLSLSIIQNECFIYRHIILRRRDDYTRVSNVGHCHSMLLHYQTIDGKTSECQFSKVIYKNSNL